METKSFVRFFGGRREIRGGSHDPAHSGWMDVLGYSVAGGRIPLGVHSGAGRAPKEVNLTMPMGPWAVDLMGAAGDGIHFDKVTIETSSSPKPGGRRATGLTFADVIVSSYQFDSPQRTPAFTCSLDFSEMSFNLPGRK